MLALPRKLYAKFCAMSMQCFDLCSSCQLSKVGDAIYMHVGSFSTLYLRLEAVLLDLITICKPVQYINTLHKHPRKCNNFERNDIKNYVFGDLHMYFEIWIICNNT